MKNKPVRRVGSFIERLRPKRRDVRVIVEVTYTNGSHGIHSTVWRHTLLSAQAVETKVRHWMFGTSGVVDIEGDTPVNINLYEVASSSVKAYEI